MVEKLKSELKIKFDIHESKFMKANNIPYNTDDCGFWNENVNKSVAIQWNDNHFELPEYLCANLEYDKEQKRLNDIMEKVKDAIILGDGTLPVDVVKLISSI